MTNPEPRGGSKDVHLSLKPHRVQTKVRSSMLPITLLNAAQGQEISIECKSGRKYTGKMQACDLFMNITLENAKRTSSELGEPTDYPELYLRGYSIKFVKIPDHLLDDIVDERQAKRQELYSSQGTRSDHRR